MPQHDLGPIVRLQVQRDPLKTNGVGYDPAPILSVAEASLDRRGMVGRAGGSWVLDVHHAAHPRVRGGGRRALSLGFTGHYEAMAERFGAADLGSAGENIVVEAEGIVAAEDLAGEVIITGSDAEIVLRGARVAAPCAEFTSFLKGLPAVAPAAEQPADVDFLDGGMRGFILDVSQLEAAVMIRVGDRVAVRPS